MPTGNTARGSTPFNAVGDLVDRPPGLLRGQVQLVLVGEQVVRPVDQPPDGGAVHGGQLLGRVGGEGDAELAALLCVPGHPRGVAGGDDHQVDLPELPHDLGEVDAVALVHRAGVERRHLDRAGVRGAGVGHHAEGQPPGGAAGGLGQRR